VVGIEQAFNDTERAAEAARKSAASVVSQARALAKAAQTGNIAGIKRCQENLKDAVTVLRQEVANVGSCWPFTDEEERQLFEERYADTLKATAAEKGLKMHEQDGLLMSYPSIVRVLAAERSVRVDRKKISTIRPSFLVDLLLQKQKKSSSFSSQRFLESLYSVYSDILGRASEELALTESGRVIPLIRIYRLMTALPGAARDYDRSDFARDLYILESQGPRRTRSGAAVSFPSSTGTRRRSSDLFSFIGPDGNNAEYYGIRFNEGGA
jgi:hypothetical protein